MEMHFQLNGVTYVLTVSMVTIEMQFNYNESY